MCPGCGDEEATPWRPGSRYCTVGCEVAGPIHVPEEDDSVG